MRSPPRRDPTHQKTPARRLRAARALPECRAAPKVLPEQRFPDQTRETWRRAGRRCRANGSPIAPACPAPARRGIRRRRRSHYRGRRKPGWVRGRPVGVTDVPSTSPIECAWSVDTISTRMPASASRTAVAVASVDFPTPPLPTKRLIRAVGGPGFTSRGGGGRSLSLGSFLEVLQRGVGQPPLGLALEQSDHRDDQVDRQFICDICPGPLGRQPICAVECPQ